MSYLSAKRRGMDLCHLQIVRTPKFSSTVVDLDDAPSKVKDLGCILLFYITR